MNNNQNSSLSLPIMQMIAQNMQKGKVETEQPAQINELEKVIKESVKTQKNMDENTLFSASFSEKIRLICIISTYRVINFITLPRFICRFMYFGKFCAYFDFAFYYQNTPIFA